VKTALIRELRERTGVGFGDCKNALVEADWDMDRAVEIVRAQSGAKAEKKADRTASEGLLGLALDGDAGAIVEINVETDFAARSGKFTDFVERAVLHVLDRGADGIAAALEDERRALVQDIGENVNVRRAASLNASGGIVAGYLHQDSKKGALVCLDGGDSELARDVAMHVTAMRPLVVAPEEVPADAVDRERAIYLEQAAEEVARKQQQSRKAMPPEVLKRIADGIVTGRVRKFLAESSLVEQPFGPRWLVAHGPGGAWGVAGSSEYSVTLHQPDGNTLHIDGPPGPGPALTASERDSAQADLDDQLEGLGGDPPFGVPDHKPPIAEIFFDRGGRLWVEKTGVRGDEMREADVYDEGMLVARYRWPRHVDLGHLPWVTGSALYGTTRDELDVVSVVRVQFEPARSN